MGSVIEKSKFQDLLYPNFVSINDIITIIIKQMSYKIKLIKNLYLKFMEEFEK